MSAKPTETVLAPTSLPTIALTFERLGAGGLPFKPRLAQLRLAEVARDILASGGIGCLEAPTGTGKTLGYLTGAIEYMAHADNPLPIVVATATVSLQEQILRYDVPRLVKAGVLDGRKVALAKGRSRYFCPRTTSVLEDKKMQSGQFDMFDSDKFVTDGGVTIALDMLKAWRNKTWDGDQDSWTGVLPGCWGSTCACSSDTCIGRVCDYYSECPYIQSRARLSKATLVIANQDMVLADLAQRSDEQDTTALPFKRYALLIDEAHHFPDKAANTRKADAFLGDPTIFADIGTFGESVWAEPTVAQSLIKKAISPNIYGSELAELVERMDQCKAKVQAQAFRKDGVATWGLNLPDDNILGLVGELAARALRLQEALKLTAAAFTAFADTAVGTQKAFGVRMLSLAHRYHGRVRSMQNGLALFYTAKHQVRWAQNDLVGNVSLHTQPMEGDRVLEEVLWRTGFPTVMVSATLQVAGSFARFKARSGLPGNAICEALPPVFDYARGYLHEPKMATEPGQAGHEAELADKLQKLFDATPIPGMLVWFTSRAAMQKVTGMMSGSFASCMLVAGTAPLPELVSKHKAAIDRGQRSILVGLDSMSEGLDLPGKYCGHFVVTRLPFAVPDDPVEAARQEHLKGAWFEKVYLADMLTKLIQGMGRLIRRESDHGIITLLDSRLSNKYYAPVVFAALPNFTRIGFIREYIDAAQEKGWDITHGYLVDADAANQATKVATKLELASSTPEPAPSSKTKKAPQLVAAGQVVPDRLPAALAAVQAAADKLGLPMVLPPALPGEGLLARMGRAYEPTGDVATMADAILPCLPPHAAPMLWAEGMLPEAVMLGLVALNRPGYRPKADWHRVLVCRPDIFQFAYIQRSHYRNLVDARRDVLTAKECTDALKQAFAGIKAPDAPALMLAVNDIEEQAKLALNGANVKWPSRQFLEAMVDFGTAQIQALRAAKKR